MGRTSVSQSRYTCIEYYVYTQTSKTAALQRNEGSGLRHVSGALIHTGPEAGPGQGPGRGPGRGPVMSGRFEFTL